MIEILILLIPAGIANMLPPLFTRIKPEWNWPVDFYKSFRGKRIFGDHKTIKGFVVGMVGSGMGYWLLSKMGLIDPLLPVYTGILLGFVSLAADCVKSFFKRQLNVKPGESWFPWDQLDWVIGALLLIRFLRDVSWLEVAVVLVIGVLVHLLVKVIGFWLKINKSAI